MSDHQAILDLTTRYLRSVYEGDVEELRKMFHPNARVEDKVTGAFRSRSVEQYIEVVALRQSPLAAGEAFTMAPLAIDVLGDMATVTAELRFLGNHFYNVLSLLLCDDQWLISHKLFGSTSR